jgi:hypothetical protein
VDWAVSTSATRPSAVAAAGWSGDRRDCRRQCRLCHDRTGAGCIVVCRRFLGESNFIAACAQTAAPRATSQATAVFSAASPFWCIARHRYAHGRHFGAARVDHGSSVSGSWEPPVRPTGARWRAARRVLRERRHHMRFMLALPLLIALAAAWSAGKLEGRNCPAALRPGWAPAGLANPATRSKVEIYKSRSPRAHAIVWSRPSSSG